MRNKKLKIDLRNIDVLNVKTDYFCEGLLDAAVKTKANCKRIDEQVLRLGVAFTPYDRAMDCYDAIVRKMKIKRELLRLYKLYAKWYVQLEDKQRKLIVAYFVMKDKKLCAEITNNAHYTKKYILPLAYSFYSYVKMMSDFTEKSLMMNPYIYNSYNSTLIKHEVTTRKYEYKFM